MPNSQRTARWVNRRQLRVSTTLAILAGMTLLPLIPMLIVQSPYATSSASLAGRETRVIVIAFAISYALFTAGWVAIGVAGYCRARRDQSGMSVVALVLVGLVGSAVQWWMLITHQGMVLPNQYLINGINATNSGTIFISTALLAWAIWNRSAALSVVAIAYTAVFALDVYTEVFSGVNSYDWIAYAVPAAVLALPAIAWTLARPSRPKVGAPALLA